MPLADEGMNCCGAEAGAIGTHVDGGRHGEVYLTRKEFLQGVVRKKDEILSVKNGVVAFVALHTPLLGNVSPKEPLQLTS